MGLDVIRDFDPWEDPLCTCPPKYGLNPYTGCAHRCIYCYITSYIPRAFQCRPKQKLLERVQRDLTKIDKKRFVSMCNSSDPYPPMEKRLMLTRKCLEIFKSEGVGVQIITKSDLVVRDIDLLKDMRCVVSFTITTLNERIRQKLEPGAPPSKRRLNAMKTLSEKGIPIVLRLDPIFPFLNEAEIENIVESAMRVGTKHVVCSTFKPRRDGWKRFERVFPEVARKISTLYFRDGSWRRNCWYLPSQERQRLVEIVKRNCEKRGMSYATCREGLTKRAPSCDGSHLLS